LELEINLKLSVKAKWDKLYKRDINTYMWVFVEGKMFVINEAGYEHNKLKLKNIYTPKSISNRTERKK